MVGLFVKLAASATSFCWKKSYVQVAESSAVTFANHGCTLANYEQVKINKSKLKENNNALWKKEGRERWKIRTHSIRNSCQNLIIKITPGVRISNRYRAETRLLKLIFHIFDEANQDRCARICSGAVNIEVTDTVSSEITKRFEKDK